MARTASSSIWTRLSQYQSSAAAQPICSNMESATLATNRIGLRLAMALLAAPLAAASPDGSAAWLQWGGPHRDFKVSAPRVHWKGAAPRRAWQRSLGDGYSSVIGDANTIYAAFRRGDAMVVTAIDADTGHSRWERELASKPLPNMYLDYGQGPNSTPLLLNGKLFVATFTGQFVALDSATGRQLWTRELWAELKGTFREVGYSNSPIAFGDLVIVPVGGPGKGLAAFRQSDGSTAWLSSNLSNAMSSPVLIDVSGETQLIALMVEGAAGFEPRTGRQLWFHPHKTQHDVNAATPVWHATSRTLIVSSAYDGGARAIRLNRVDGKTIPEEAWFNRRLRVHHGNMLVIGDHVYGSSGDFGPAPLTALSVSTGNVAWQDRRFPKAGLVHTGDRTLLLDEDGRVAIVKLSPSGLGVMQEAQVTSKLSWTAPTLIGYRLYVRDRQSLVALELDRQP